MPAFVVLSDNTVVNVDESASQVRTMVEGALGNRAKVIELKSNDGNGSYFVVPDGIVYFKDR